MLRNRDIIITGIQSWDISIGSNIKNIAIELSKENRVLFVNPPIDRISKITKRSSLSRITKETLHQINSNLWILQPHHIIESINYIPIVGLFDMMNRSNNIRFAKDIVKALSILGFLDYIHICDSDMFRSFYLKDLLSPSLSVYYSRDNLQAVNYWKRHGKRIEPLLIEKVDLVLTNSLFLSNKAKLYNNNSFFVGQGCDTKAYTPNVYLKIPKDIASIKKPIVGYIGSLNSLRLDIEVLEFIAITKKEWQIVLVGPEDSTFKSSNLHHLSNVHFLGLKNENELPEYLNKFDVAINPQKINEVTIGNYPRKIDEYLAMGKPTVATKTEAMEYFKDYVSLAKDKKDWISMIELEMESTGSLKKLQRIQFASEHTWKNNVNSIGKYIIRKEQGAILAKNLYESAF
ncbi:glycosyltransferase [Plebeiibacterium sediminum]|uniref:Glycosyltransferase n=1 Tax=Plebeiibacterium sediminum TaxID=2992112 RepID=A0AAE3M5T3_9BACT|nr:glycosyltransferase [Plebeiobacterium sediminum]MCW3787476.1 glycosyltransferase [Plebeiobacterium sediminum]